MGEFLLKTTSCTLLKNMKVIASYMLAVVGGNAKPSAADVKKILSSVGIDLAAEDESRLEELVEEVAGKELADVLKAGQEKLKTVPGGGSGGGGAAAPEAAKEESEEEDEVPAAGGLFDAGDDY